jgi:histidinol dehydrogenase
MRLFNTQQIGLAEARRLLSAPTAVTDPGIERIVRSILADVRERGEAAVLEHTQRLDSAAVTSANLRVSDAEFEAAAAQVSPEFNAAVEEASKNIREFHELQQPRTWFDTSRPGLIRGQMVRPLNRVGVCVPGASAPLASTALMTVIPAKVAGVPEVFVITPPRRDGTINPHVLVASRTAGATGVFKCFGAQAVGAMAFGAGQIPRVDKIVGPGSAYVVTAKRLVYGFVDIEALPGPSEIMLIADGSVDAAFAAADLISQAEHPDGRAVLLSTSAAFAQEVLAEIDSQTAALPSDTLVRKSLADHGLALVIASLDEAFDLADIFAPEHLVLHVEDPVLWLPRAQSAGTVLFGPYTSKAIDDYAAGPSHVLPTGGTARFSSGLGLRDFVRWTNVVSCSRAMAARLAPVVETLAEAEGLPAHRAASALRRRESSPSAAASGRAEGSG